MTKIVIGTYGIMSKATNLLVKELQEYGDVTVLIDKQQPITIEGVEYIKLENKGLDLGKLKQYINKYLSKLSNLENFIYCNDTVSLIGSLEKLISRGLKQDNTFRGACDAYTNHSKLKDFGGYHIQSYFRGINGQEEINNMLAYYTTTKLVDNREYVIVNYELGLSEYMQRKEINLDAYIKSDLIIRKYGLHRYNQDLKPHGITIHDPKGEFNGAFEYPKLYIDEGLPFVKNSCMQYHFKDITLLPYLTNKIYETNTI